MRKRRRKMVEEIEKFCREERKRQGLTRAELAEKAEITPYALKRFETDAQDSILGLTCRVVNALGYDLTVSGESMDPQKLGKLVRQEREERGLSRRELAAAAGVSAHSLENLEEGNPVKCSSAEAFLEVLGYRLRIEKSPDRTREADGRLPEFGRFCRDIREEKGWPLQELAEKSGVSEEVIRRFEAGTYSLSYQSLEAILGALGYRLTIREAEQHGR